jgi:Fe-S-cluster containining protein
MTLTEIDVRRLEASGHRDFFFVNDDHDLQLVNVNGHCIFLVQGRCSVYDYRPDGCRVYPLILDLSVDRVILDSECPWASEFTFTGDDEVLLRNSVIDEDLEARLRRERRGGRSLHRTGTTGRS